MTLCIPTLISCNDDDSPKWVQYTELDGPIQDGDYTCYYFSWYPNNGERHLVSYYLKLNEGTCSEAYFVITYPHKKEAKTAWESMTPAQQAVCKWNEEACQITYPDQYNFIGKQEIEIINQLQQIKNEFRIDLR